MKIPLGKEIIGASLLDDSYAGYPFTKKRVEDDTTWVGISEMEPEGDGLRLSLFDMTQTHPVLLAKVEHAGAMDTLCEVIEFGIDPTGQLRKLRIGYNTGSDPDGRKIAEAIKVLNQEVSNSKISLDQLGELIVRVIRNAISSRSWFEFNSENF